MPRSTAPVSLALALVLSLGACGGGEDAASGESGAAVAAGAASSQSADEQLADLGEYRLTMDNFDQYLAAQRNVARAAQRMSPAERAAIEARSDANGTDQSLDGMTRNIEREPVVNAAVREAGLSAREFTLLTMSIMQSSMAAGIQKMRPDDDQDSLARAMKANPDNVRFIRENEAELTRKQQAIAEEMKRLAPPDGDS